MKIKTILVTLLLLFTLSACNNKPDDTVDPVDNVDPYEVILDAMENISVDDTVGTIVLPPNHGNVSITWTSNIAGTITDNGVTIQGQDNQLIQLTALFTYQGVSLTKLYSTTVLESTEADTTLAEIIAVMEDISFPSFNLEDDIALLLTDDGVTISWQSNNTSCMESNGLIYRPESNEDDCVVTLTATFTKDGESQTKDFTFTIIALEDSNNTVYEGYYLGADGLEGVILKAFLHDLIDDHTILTYDDVKYALRDTDEDPNNPNNVILLYTGRSQAKTTFGGGANDWNREHVWAKSHGDFGNNMGPGTDLHHLRPTDASVNSSRGNLDFDNGGSLVNETTDCYKDGDSWEPRDEVKGDVARMMFYMAVRYEGDDSFVDLELNNQVNNSGPYIGKLSVLLEWHLQDPVDDFEMNRNNVIFSYQGNRNPFIDHPEFAELIWG